MYPLANLRTAYVDEWRVEKKYILRQGRCVDIVFTARIDGYLVVLPYLVGMSPAVEGCPIVTANEQGECVFRLFLGKMAERNVHV